MLCRRSTIRLQDCIDHRDERAKLRLRRRALALISRGIENRRSTQSSLNSDQTHAQPPAGSAPRQLQIAEPLHKHPMPWAVPPHQISVENLVLPGHVWNGPGFKIDVARIWRRHECGHVSGFLVRPHDRQPRWVPRMASKQICGIDVPLTQAGLPPFVGSTDHHLLLSLLPPWQARARRARQDPFHRRSRDHA